MRKEIFAAAVAALLMMGALILGKSLQEILVVLLALLFVRMKRKGGKER